MKRFRVFKWALKSIARNPTRTFLTTLGIIIGIAAVIAVIEIGSGAQVSLENNFSEMGVNTIRVWPGPVTRSGINSGSGSWATLTMADTRAIIKECPKVTAISPQISVRGQIIYGNKNWRPFSISGGNEDFLEISSWKVEDGIPISASHVARAAKVCLVGQTIVRELYDGVNPVGKDLRIQNVVFKVIGVLKSRGANMMGMDMDDCVILPWTTMKSRLKGAGQTSLSAVGTTTDTSTTSSTSASDVYTSGVSLYPKAYNTIPPVRFSNIDSMIMSVAHPDDIAETMEKVREVLRETHRLGDADDDFRIRSLAEFADHAQKADRERCEPAHVRGVHIASRRWDRHNEHNARLRHGAHARDRAAHGCRRARPRHIAAVSGRVHSHLHTRRHNRDCGRPRAFGFHGRKNGLVHGDIVFCDMPFRGGFGACRRRIRILSRMEGRAPRPDRSSQI